MATVHTPEASLRTSSSNLLTIPLEIRLQIYNHVLLSHPASHAHLAPLVNLSGLNTEEFLTTMVRANAPTATHTITRNNISDTKPVPHFRNMERVQGRIPTELLLSCKQIFEETRLVPWHANTFAFVNWFWSGVYAARQFTRGLEDWQSAEIRNTTIEILGRDLWIGGMESSTGGFGGKEGKGVGEWRELCAMWSGVRDLRLGIKGSLMVDSDCEKVCILDVERDWVAHGLCRMTSLRWLEVELEDEDISRETKLAFCVELQSVLGAKVVFVEKVRKEEPKLVYYGGEPGDEHVWG